MVVEDPIKHGFFQIRIGLDCSFPMLEELLLSIPWMLFWMRWARSWSLRSAVSALLLMLITRLSLGLCPGSLVFGTEHPSRLSQFRLQFFHQRLQSARHIQRRFRLV